jgi:hypothetical protein
MIDRTVLWMNFTFGVADIPQSISLSTHRTCLSFCWHALICWTVTLLPNYIIDSCFRHNRSNLINYSPCYFSLHIHNNCSMVAHWHIAGPVDRLGGQYANFFHCQAVSWQRYCSASLMFELTSLRHIRHVTVFQQPLQLGIFHSFISLSL